MEDALQRGNYSSRGLGTLSKKRRKRRESRDRESQILTQELKVPRTVPGVFQSSGWTLLCFSFVCFFVAVFFLTMLEALVDFAHNHPDWSIRRFEVPRF